MPKKLSAWDQLRNRDSSQTTQYRDVYEDQQLDRTSLGHKRSMKSRVVADIAMTIFFFFIFWVVFSIIEAIQAQMTGTYEAPETFFADAVVAVYAHFIGMFTFRKFFFDLVFSGVFFGVMYLILYRSLQVQNEDEEVSDINNYPNDQHIALPEELQYKFDWFPDVGATSDIQFSSMISHMALSNKGLKTVQVAKRATEDILDEDGEIILHKGEIMRDEDGNAIMEEKPLVDKDFMHALFDASGLPNEKRLRKFYDTTQIPYNPDGKNRDKLGKFATVADLINADWQLPEYEPQRPAGAYLVDTAPVNTMGATC